MKIYPPQNHHNNVRKRRERFTFVVMRDVPIRYGVEEFVEGTVHRGQKRLANTKDVPIRYRKKEFV